MTKKTTLLVVVLVVAGGIAWAIHAAMRAQTAQEFEDARFQYNLKSGTKRLHDTLNRRLVELGKRKPLEETPDDERIDREASAAERAYVRACKRCASASECEYHRQNIELGRGSESYNPCD